MSNMNRRDFLKVSAGIAGGAAAGMPLLAEAQTAWKPEKGAKLRVLRWSRFVQGDIDAYMLNVKKFTEKTGIEVRVDNEGWEDVRPKAAVAANTGAGPDLFWGLYSLPHLFPQKCLDVTDVADYLGKKYGGWVPSAVTAGSLPASTRVTPGICRAADTSIVRMRA